MEETDRFIYNLETKKWYGIKDLFVVENKDAHGNVISYDFYDKTSTCLMQLCPLKIIFPPLNLSKEKACTDSSDPGSGSISTPDFIREKQKMSGRKRKQEYRSEQCPYCNKTLLPESIREHITSKHKCPYCDDFEERDGISVLKHCRDKHHDELPQCTYCPQTSLYERKIRQHEKRCRHNPNYSHQK